MNYKQVNYIRATNKNKMTKGTKAIKFAYFPLNGMRAIKGKYREEKGISLGKTKEEKKQADIHNEKIKQKDLNKI